MKLNKIYLQKILNYDIDSGVFVWKVQISNRIKVNSIAGTLHKKGYIEIKISGIKYKAHRLAWLFIYGEIPNGQIDHINHNRQDNRIANLRCVTNQENARNKSLSSNNASGFTGVSWHKAARKWKARIIINYKEIHLGCFLNIEDAIKARLEANILYNFHINHGKLGL